ncbi:MAG: crotonase/enoyl-CoA hydratase family protein [Pseudomonadota bacterium]
MERIEITVENHVAEVVLNRPEKKNALDPLFFEELPQAAESLAGRADVRAVVIRGAGGVFCAGIDTSSLMGMAQRLDDTRAILRGTPPEGNRFQRPSLAWQELGVPVIAAIEGVAFGAGVQLALAADFRFVAPGARMSIMEMKWGIIPDMGLTQSLPQLMPADRAKDLIMTGRIVEGAEAVSLGLATWLHDDPVGAARDYASMIAGKNPDAVRGAKALVDRTWGAGVEGLALEGELQADIMGAPNQIEAVTAQMQGRPAKYA